MPNLLHSFVSFFFISSLFVAESKLQHGNYHNSTCNGIWSSKLAMANLDNSFSKQVTDIKFLVAYDTVNHESMTVAASQHTQDQWKLGGWLSIWHKRREWEVQKLTFLGLLLQTRLTGILHIRSRQAMN